MRHLTPLVVATLTSFVVACSSSESSTAPGTEGAGGTDGDASVDAPDDTFVNPNACVDEDGDGHNAVASSCSTGVDCDDSDANVHPSALEKCGDGIDNNCNGEVDEEGCLSCSAGERVACYTGSAGTKGVGACRVGVAVCDADGNISECLAEVTPVDEIGADKCDFVDNDCDGEVDEFLRNACLECSASEPLEVCGDGIDNNCDGQADEGCNCDFHCVCPPSGPCDCKPPTNQPCYEGPHGTGGVGICRGGRRDCRDDLGTAAPVWGECMDQVLPASECAGGVANGLDDDCNGLVDDGCVDNDGDGSAWPLDCDDTDPTINPSMPEVCNGVDDNCNGVADEGVTNACGGCGAVTNEVCDNGFDDDCDGLVDEDCQCSPGATQPCYGGPPATLGVASCKPGEQKCDGAEFGTWGACVGQVLPALEICDGVDNDCDGEVDQRWAAGSNPCGYCEATEVCDGKDNDCDGLVDEHVANSCGECGPEKVEVCNGVDDDCDGIVDEGVTNACGTCPPEPCFEGNWDKPSECSDALGTTCTSVEPHPDYPNSVTLGQVQFDHRFIYIAVTNKNEVAQLDTDTGQKKWQMSSHGCQPSRTAVAMDGSVWVGNRGHGSGCDPNNPAYSSVVHLDRETGALICRADVVGLARGVAIDANGDVWGGGYNSGVLWQISGTDVDNTQSPPRCVVKNTYPLGVNIYGLAVDPNGYVWTASSPNTVRLQISSGTTETFPNPTHYGIAPDGAGRMWFGGWSGSGNIHAIDNVGQQSINTGINNVTAVTVHPNGTVWGSRYGTNEIVGYDPVTQAQICVAPIPSGTNPHGAAVDRMGRLWVPSRFTSGTVNVFDTACTHLATYVVDAGQELYSYSDMTGHLLQTFTNPEGTWTQVFDSGYNQPYWTGVEWDADIPANTAIDVTVRAASTKADLGTAQPCGPFGASPADLTSCAFLNNNRYLQVSAKLSSSQSGARPILHAIRAYWAY